MHFCMVSQYIFYIIKPFEYLVQVNYTVVLIRKHFMIINCIHFNDIIYSLSYTLLLHDILK